MNVTKTDDGLIFVDRNPELFMKILEGLRGGGQIFTDSASEALQLLEELLFLGLDASCPKLNVWEKSATEQLFVKWGCVGGRDDHHALSVGASQAVLKEVAPVFGYGGSIQDEFQGHQVILFDVSRNHVNPALANNGQLRNDTGTFAFRLCALLGERGFEEKCYFGMGNEIAGTMVFARKKLWQREQPFIINILLPKQPRATCNSPFQVGVKVLAHSLGKADLNGAVGTVVGHQGDRVIVEFQEPLGKKALKPENLTLPADSFQETSVSGAHADSVQAMHRGPSGDIGLLVSDGQSSGEDRADDIYTSAALLTDIQKGEAIDSDLKVAIQQSEKEALQQEQADVAQAIFESTLQSNGGIVLRLTHHDQEVRESLMTAEVLDDCRRRVTEAGCELSPEWGNGALFLLPFREPSKFQELQLQGIRLEDLKPYNIVALRGDEDLVKQALAQVPRRRRPQCKREAASSACSTTIPVPEAGTVPDPAPDFLSDITVVIEHTFYTFYTVKGAQESSNSSVCRSAPC